MHQYNSTADAVALVAATAKTVLQINAPSSRRGKIKEIGIGFSSTNTAHSPVLVRLMRATTAGTSTSTTPAPLDPADPVALFTAGKNFSAEPTLTDELRRWRITPVGGQAIVPLALGDEIFIGTSGRLALVCTAPDAQTADAYIVHEE